MKVPVRSNGTFAAGRPEKVMDWSYGGYFEIAPDGRFLALKNAAATDQDPSQSRLVAVLHWFTELQQRVPTR
jgi:hypothetical protein